MSQTSICLKPVISTSQQLLCSQHCCVLQLTPKYFSETGFCALKSFNLALLFCLSFTIHIGSDEDLWRGVLDLTVMSQIKAMESSGLSRTRNPADLRGRGSGCVCRPSAQLQTELSVDANQPLHVRLSLVKKISILYATGSRMLVALFCYFRVK